MENIITPLLNGHKYADLNKSLFADEDFPSIREEFETNFVQQCYYHHETIERKKKCNHDPIFQLQI